MHQNTNHLSTATVNDTNVSNIPITANVTPHT